MTTNIETILSGLNKANQKIDDLKKRGVFFGEELVILAQNPGIAALWKQLGIASQIVDGEFEQVRPDETQDFFDIAILLGPFDVESRSEKGSFLFYVDDRTVDALAVYQEARNLCLKQLAECTEGLVECLNEIGCKEEATKMLAETLKICPGSEELLALQEEWRLLEEGGTLEDKKESP